MKKCFTLVIITLISLAGGWVWADTATLDSDADTWVREGSTSNYGDYVDMQLLGGTGRVGYIRFDLSSLGQVEITDATLTLTKVTGSWSRNDGMVNGRIGIVGLDNVSGNTSQSWNESSLNASNVGDEFVGGKSGYPIESSLSTNLDADNGADVTESVTSGITFTLTGNDLVTFLQARLNDGGLATFIATLTSADTKGFWLATKENTTEEYRPVLAITYTPSRIAYSPYPEDGANVSTNSILSWRLGYEAVRSEVYLGTNSSSVATAEKLAGDVDGDGSVDLTDLNEMAGQWLLLPSMPCPDLDYSGIVDITDFAAISSDWQGQADAVYLGATDGSTFDPGTLDEATTYYWRVDTVTCDGIKYGDLWNFQTEAPTMPAFPGAEGFGAMANGGRGGDVYTVTNLNSSGEGSLVYGIDNAPYNGRTIVFAVSGYITIANDSTTGDKTILIDKDNITIAGQTAPGDGIGLKGGRIYVTGDNVVLRHLRIRHGKYGGAGDCLNLASSATNTIIDHVSLMFSTDENISFFNSSLDNFTMQYCTSSWGMERHNAGGLWDLVDGTCHHTLWAHHRTRNPKARPYGLLEWINNVTYHWRSEGFIMGDSESNVDWYANVIGCYYISIADYGFGLDSTPLSKGRIASDGKPNFHLYLSDTMIDANGDGVLNGTDNGYGIVSGLPYDPDEGAGQGSLRYDQAETAFAGADVAVTTDDPLTAYKKVLSSAGALRLDVSADSLRDELDELLIESVENQESILVAKDSPVTEDPDEPPSNGEQHLADDYGITNSGFGTLDTADAPTDTDGDGMPDFWELAIGSDQTLQNQNNYVPADAFVSLGYTLLDEYLHFCAVPHAAIAMNTTTEPSSLTVDLSRYTCGFNVSPVTFTLSEIRNGAATIQSDGCTVVFDPTVDYSGRAGFDFTVTDGDGCTWTQTLAVIVEES